MKLNLLVLVLFLQITFQSNSMNRYSYISLGSSALGICSLAWQIYTKDYTFKKSLLTRTLFMTGLGSLLWGYKNRVKTVSLPKKIVIPISKEVRQELSKPIEVSRLQELISLHGFKDVKNEFDKDISQNLAYFLAQEFNKNKLSAQQFYEFGLNNLGWDNLIISYELKYLNYKKFQEILQHIKSPEEINAFIDDDSEIGPIEDLITPLHYVVGSGDDVPLIKMFIETGADVFAASKMGVSVYDYALKYNAKKTAHYIKQYVKLKIALVCNCRDIVFKGAKAREFCTKRIRDRYEDIESTNQVEFERIGTQLMISRMKNGPNASGLSIELIDYIAEFALSSNYVKVKPN